MTLEPPIVVEVEYRNAIAADYAAIVPGAERTGDRGVRFEADDPVTAYRGFLAGVRLAGHRRLSRDLTGTRSRLPPYCGS